MKSVQCFCPTFLMALLIHFLGGGRSLGTYLKSEVSKDAVLDMMAGGAEMQTLMAELDGVTI